MSRNETKYRAITVDDIEKMNSKLPESHALNVKRQLRAPLLEALDIYDKNVSKGRINESETEMLEVNTWYKDICDLKDEAFQNIPTRIRKYR